MQIGFQAQNRQHTPGWWLGLLLVLGLGLWLRGSLVPYGLPYLFYEDEPIYFTRALNLLAPDGSPQFDPHYFKKPGFFLYFYFGFYYAAYWLQGAGPWASPWGSFVEGFWQNPTLLATLGRWVTVAFAGGTIALVYLMGKRLFHPAVGLGAAFLLAIDPTHLQYSPIVISDIPSSFAIVLAGYFAINVWRHGSVKDYLLAGAAVGLAMAFKYNAFAFSLPVAAHLLRTVPSAWRSRQFGGLLNHNLWLCAAATAATFLLLCPYTVLNWQGFVADFDLERRHMLLRDAESATRSPSLMAGFGKVFFKILPKALGWFIYVGAILITLKTAIELLWKKNIRWLPCLLLLAFPLTFWLITSQFRIVNAKYLLPTYPFVFLLVLGGIWLCNGLQGATPLKRGLIFTFVIAVLAFSQVSQSLGYQAMFSQPDTRVAAVDYLIHHASQWQMAYIEPETIPVGVPAKLRQGSTFIHAEEGQLVLGELFAQTTETPMEMGVFWEYHPQIIIVSLNPRKLKDGTLVLPYFDDYYQHLNRYFAVEEVVHPYQSVALPQQKTLDLLALYHHIEAQHPKRIAPGPVLVILKQTKPLPPYPTTQMVSGN